MKLLIVYRPDGEPARRIAMVEEFVDRCRAAGLVSIIEPVSRAPRDHGDWCWDDGVLAAARELGGRGADLYKAEVPRHCLGAADDIRRSCARLSQSIHSSWVVLSSGVSPEMFPRAVELACAEGAQGFLAGRAVWKPCIGADNLERAFSEGAVARLSHLCEVADAGVQPAHGVFKAKS